MERLQEEYNLAIKWIAFPLHPDTPAEGRTLEELFAGRMMDIPVLLEKLRAVAESEGLPFGNRTHTYNSRLAQELSKWAEEMGAGEAYHDALFRAYFVDGLNIARPEILGDIVAELGLSAIEALEVLDERAYALKVEEDWQYSRDMEVMAVPTFAAGGRLIVGAQPYEVLEQLVQHAGAEEKIDGD